MSSFDTGRGIIILEAAQWDVLERMLTGPAAERATYAEGALAGLEDLGVIDPYGPTEAARGVLAGLVAADARYVLRRLDPADAVSVRDLVIFLAAPRCTIARYDADGVHIYACDDVEVPHIALANDHLYPRPVIDDGPEEIFDTLASAARLADIEAAVRLMQVIGRNGPRASSFVRDAEAGQWTMAMRMRQDRDRDDFTLTGQMLTLGVRSMLYEIMEQPGPLTDPAGTPTNIPLRPVLGTEVWATISSWIWAMP